MSSPLNNGDSQSSNWPPIGVTLKSREQLLGKDAEEGLPPHEGLGRWREEGHEEPLVEDGGEAAMMEGEPGRHSSSVIPDKERQESKVEETRV